MSNLKVGDQAPDFNLLYSKGKSIRLSEELKKGPVVLVFYPADFSSVCQEELCTFRDTLSEFNDLGLRITYEGNEGRIVQDGRDSLY